MVRRSLKTSKYCYLDIAFSDFNGEKILKTYYEKGISNIKSRRIYNRKSDQKREINYMSNRKAMIIHLIVWLMKKTLYQMSQYFLKLYKHFGGEINVKVDLQNNYAKKTE